MLQTYIPFLPKGAKPINSHVAIYFHDKKFEFFTLLGPIHSCWESDLYGAPLPHSRDYRNPDSNSAFTLSNSVTDGFTNYSNKLIARR